MKVLHIVATGERRGAETFASELVAALGDSGIEQQVAVLRWTGEVQVPFRAPTSVWESNGSLARGLNVDLRTVLKLNRLLNHWQPQLVQAHGSEALRYAAASAISRKRPIVYRKIGILAPWAREGPRRRGHGILARRAARVVAVAEAVRQEALDLLRVPPLKVVTIPSGVDPRRLVPSLSRTEMRSRLGVAADARVVLFLGALTWEKDPLAAIDVFARAAELSPASALIIAGDGPLRGEVERTLRSSCLQDRIRLLGNRSDVGDLLNATDVLLLSSQAEGMPGCLIEAGMAGLPVVAFSVGGVAEVVDDKSTGLLALPGQKEVLASHLAHVLTSSNTAASLGKAAKGRCLGHFDTRHIAKRYLDLYREVAAL